MKYIRHNIKNFAKRETLLFIVILICVTASAFILNFSYGLYKNFQTSKVVETENLQRIALEINKDAAPTHTQVQQFVEALSEEALSQMSFYISGTIDELDGCEYPYLESRFTYRNGAYAVPSEFRKNAEEQLASGRVLTDAEEANGDFVACIEASWNLEKSNLLLQDDSTISFMQREYSVIGSSGAIANMMLPFLAVPEDFVYNDVIIIDFDKSLNRSIYTELITSSDTYMPGALIFPELKLPDADTISIFDNIIVIAILISVFSAVNYVLLYHFILCKRTHELAVLRICGCNKLQCFWIYMGECLLISIPCYATGSVVYYFTLHTILKKIYPYILDSYSLKVCGFIFVLYMAALLAVVGIMIACHINQSVVSQVKERSI